MLFFHGIYTNSVNFLAIAVNATFLGFLRCISDLYFALYCGTSFNILCAYNANILLKWLFPFFDIFQIVILFDQKSTYE